jgi:hypothetical protein
MDDGQSMSGAFGGESEILPVSRPFGRVALKGRRQPELRVTQGPDDPLGLDHLLKFARMSLQDLWPIRNTFLQTGACGTVALRSCSRFP